jgi:serine phosphatase RsbU (regulator of sigma subunit)
LLKPTGVAIELIEETNFGQNSLDLHEGDLLVLYTDGVTKAVNRNDSVIQNEQKLW